MKTEQGFEAEYGLIAKYYEIWIALTGEKYVSRGRPDGRWNYLLTATDKCDQLNKIAGFQGYAVFVVENGVLGRQVYPEPRVG
jgi:hypothetical protein